MKYRLLQQFQNLGIAKKLFVLSLGVSFTSIFCILLVNYHLSTSIVRKQTGELIQANLQQTVLHVESFYKNYERIIREIYMDDFYVKQLKSINQWNVSEQYQAEHKIVEKLKTICYKNQGIVGLAILGTHYDTCFYDTITQSSQNSICFDFGKIRRERIRNKIEDNTDIVYYLNLQKDQKENEGKQFLYVIHRLTDFSKYQKGEIGFVILCLEGKELEQIYQHGNTGSNQTFVLDSIGNIVCCTGDTKIPHMIVEDKGQKEIEQIALQYVLQHNILKGKKFVTRSIPILENKFFVVNIQDYQYGMLDFQIVSTIIIFIGILVGILCTILVVYISDGVDMSLRPILFAMEQTKEGKKDSFISLEKIKGVEFQKIAKYYNHMIRQILLARKLEREALIREKNSEIRALEAQINPHFIYNTLDAINWLAIEKREYTISKMLTGLATILRYSIHKSNEIVSLQSELIYLKKYIHLQQQRLNYSFLCSIYVDEDLYEVKLHKMLIQPLIENVLNHGFPSNFEVDEIKIQITSIENECLKIQVIDNGKGMSEELVQKFNTYDYRKDKIESSVGLKNIIARLHLYYGENGKLWIVSNNTGTEITMTIPKIQVEEDTQYEYFDC